MIVGFGLINVDTNQSRAAFRPPPPPILLRMRLPSAEWHTHQVENWPEWNWTLAKWRWTRL